MEDLYPGRRTSPDLLNPANCQGRKRAIGAATGVLVEQVSRLQDEGRLSTEKATRVVSLIAHVKESAGLELFPGLLSELEHKCGLLPDKGPPIFTRISRTELQRMMGVLTAGDNSLLAAVCPVWGVPCCVGGGFGDWVCDGQTLSALATTENVAPLIAISWCVDPEDQEEFLAAVAEVMFSIDNVSKRILKVRMGSECVGCILRLRLALGPDGVSLVVGLLLEKAPPSRHLVAGTAAPAQRYAVMAPHTIGDVHLVASHLPLVQLGRPMDAEELRRSATVMVKGIAAAELFARALPQNGTTLAELEYVWANSEKHWQAATLVQHKQEDSEDSPPLCRQVSFSTTPPNVVPASRSTSHVSFGPSIDGSVDLHPQPLSPPKIWPSQAPAHDKQQQQSPQPHGCMRWQALREPLLTKPPLEPCSYRQAAVKMGPGVGSCGAPAGGLHAPVTYSGVYWREEEPAADTAMEEDWILEGLTM